MTEISRATLFGKLNSLAYKAIEGATVFCKLRGNPYVELVHWIQQILQTPDSDLHRIVRHFELDSSRLAKDITDALDRLPRGATSISDFSSHVENAVERGWVYATLMFGESRVRTGHLVVGILKTSVAAQCADRHLAPVRGDQARHADRRVREDRPRLAGRAARGRGRIHDRRAGRGQRRDGACADGQAGGAKRFATDLTEKARKGEIDPVSGRDEEIRQIVDILMRRRQNNPILTGEAGVGKTAVVEGFALRLVRGDVPPALQNVSLYTLDIGLLQAGASMKGEFENRLRQVIDEVQASPKPIILFVDEAHTLIGAGGAQGTGDAANLLKPALARGTLRTIAATTWAEYKKYIEKDPALTRRFQVVQVAEPSEDKAILMVRGVASVLEKHHRVQVLDEALEAAVRLSHRYIPARQLPDKAVSLLDTACARVAISQHAVPAQLEDCRRKIEATADRAGDHRARGGGRHRRHRRGVRPRANSWPRATSAACSWRSGGSPSASSSTASWRFALSSAAAPSRSKAPAASSSRRRRRRRPREETTPADPLDAGAAHEAARRARRAPGEVERGAGRVAADSAERR